MQYLWCAEYIQVAVRKGGIYKQAPVFSINPFSVDFLHLQKEAQTQLFHIYGYVNSVPYPHWTLQWFDKEQALSQSLLSTEAGELRKGTESTAESTLMDAIFSHCNQNGFPL